jgi:OCT family organic cation transporter-like MFS transporter 16
MEIKIEKFFDIAGSNHNYQIFTLITTFVFWFCFEILSVSLSFLEMMPYVQYSINGTIFQTKLNYDICRRYNFTELNRTYASWVSEFNGECDEIGTGLIGTFSFFGVLIGALLFQGIADIIGRRKSILIASTGFVMTMIGFQFVNSMNQVLFFSILLQIYCSLGGLSSFLLMNEVISSNSRSLYGAIVQSSFSISGVIFIAMYYFMDSWRIPFLITAILCIICSTIYFFYGFESPRYFLNLNQIDSFVNCLKNIATFNGLQKSFEKNVMNNYSHVFKEDNQVNVNIENEEFLKKDVETKKNMEILILLQKLKKNQLLRGDNTKTISQKNNAYSLLKYTSQRKNFLIMCYLWFCTSGIYYGLTINIKNLPGNTYFTGIIMFIVESIAYIMSGYIINIPFFGRKKSISLLYSISFLIYSYIHISQPQDIVMTSLSLAARFCVSGVYNIIYTYSTEVYPTVVRSSGLGLNSVCARIGGMVFPLILEILQERITFVFLSLNGVALILVLSLPETHGKVLSDFIPEDYKDERDPKEEVQKNVEIEDCNKNY